MKPRPANPAYLCDVCREDFGSESAFDWHWIGVHDYTMAEGLRMDPPRENGCRCLTPEEMQKKGMHKDRLGRWRRNGTSPNPHQTGVQRPPELWSTRRAAA